MSEVNEAMEVADTEVADIDSAESTVDNEEQDVSEETDVEETPENETLEKDDELGNNDKEEGSDDFVPFTKKARNAISYRDKKIAKLQAQLRETQQAQQQPSQQQQQSDPNAPSEDQFDSYADYIKASAKYEIMQELKDQQPQAQAQEYNLQEQQHIAQAQANLQKKEQEYSKSIPDYQEVISEHMELLSYLPDEIKQVFNEADDAPLAIYNLAKSGDLAGLAEVSPYKAAMIIERAQFNKPAQTKVVAPKHAPIKGTTGAGRSGKTIDDMTPDEILKKYNL